MHLSLTLKLVTLFLHHFQIPLDDEPFVQVKRSFAIGLLLVTVRIVMVNG